MFAEEVSGLSHEEDWFMANPFFEFGWKSIYCMCHNGMLLCVVWVIYRIDFEKLTGQCKKVDFIPSQFQVWSLLILYNLLHIYSVVLKIVGVPLQQSEFIL